MSSVHIALVGSGHMGVNSVDRGRVGQSSLCRVKQIVKSKGVTEKQP